MSVNNGDKANADTFNNGFLSRVANSGTIGRITLARPGSGNAISDTQLTINENKTRSETNESNITALDTRVTDLENNAAPLNNFGAVAEPAATNDSNEGYSLGSIWTTVSGKAFIAMDVSPGSAVWKRIDEIMLKINDTYFNNDLTLDNVNWIELVADTGADIIRQLQVFYTTGSIAQLGIGPNGSETELALVQSGGGVFDVEIPANSRLSIRIKDDEPDVTNQIKLAINFLIEA